MTRTEKTIIKMKGSPKNISFLELIHVCQHYFGVPRQNGTSHCVFKTPWSGDPRINIQRGEHGKAKVYQVKQVLIAIDKLENMR